MCTKYLTLKSEDSVIYELVDVTNTQFIRSVYSKQKLKNVLVFFLIVSAQFASKKCNWHQNDGKMGLFQPPCH